MTDRQLPGAEVARGFYADVVEPLLSRALPELRYAAARLGTGSDVLGLDDAMSRDHDWGCRLTLLVDDDARDQVPRISAILEEELPERFGEFPVRFPVTWDSSLSHKVEVATVADFAASRLGVDPSGGLSALDWVTVTGQSVLEVTAGPVFADRTRTLAAVRTLLAWYPPDVERYVLAAGWQRVCQLLPMMGRTAEAGDELGSRLLSASLAGDLLWLAFALSRRWAPYAKWRGTVFRSLPAAARLGPLLERRRSAAVAGTRKRADLRLPCAPRPPERTRAAGVRVRGDSLLRPALPHGGRGRTAGAPGRHHRPGRQTAAAHGGLHRAMGRLHRRLVQPWSPGGLAGGLPNLGRHQVGRRRCRRQSACARRPRPCRSPQHLG